MIFWLDLDFVIPRPVYWIELDFYKPKGIVLNLLAFDIWGVRPPVRDKAEVFIKSRANIAYYSETL